jgi:hypothetical protein
MVGHRALDAVIMVRIHVPELVKMKSTLFGVDFIFTSLRIG